MSRIIEKNTNLFIRRKRTFFCQKILDIIELNRKYINDKTEVYPKDIFKSQFERNFLTKRENRKSNSQQHIENNNFKGLNHHSSMSNIPPKKNIIPIKKFTKSTDNIFNGLIGLEFSDLSKIKRDVAYKSPLSLFSPSEVKIVGRSKNKLPKLINLSLNLEKVNKISKDRIKIKKGNLKFNNLFKSPSQIKYKQIIYHFDDNKIQN